MAKQSASADWYKQNMPSKIADQQSTELGISKDQLYQMYATYAAQGQGGPGSAADWSQRSFITQGGPGQSNYSQNQQIAPSSAYNWIQGQVNTQQGQQVLNPQQPAQQTAPQWQMPQLGQAQAMPARIPITPLSATSQFGAATQGAAPTMNVPQANAGATSPLFSLGGGQNPLIGQLPIPPQGGPSPLGPGIDPRTGGLAGMTPPAGFKAAPQYTPQYYNPAQAPQPIQNFQSFGPQPTPPAGGPQAGLPAGWSQALAGGPAATDQQQPIQRFASGGQVTSSNQPDSNQPDQGYQTGTSDPGAQTGFYNPLYGMSAFGAAATGSPLVVNPTPSGTMSSGGVQTVGQPTVYQTPAGYSGQMSWGQLAQTAGLSQSDIDNFQRQGLSAVQVAQQLNIGNPAQYMPGVFNKAPTPTLPGPMTWNQVGQAAGLSQGDVNAFKSQGLSPDQIAARFNIKSPTVGWSGDPTRPLTANAPANAAQMPQMQITPAANAGAAAPQQMPPAAPGGAPPQMPGGAFIGAHMNALADAGRALFAHFGGDPNSAGPGDIANFHTQLTGMLGQHLGQGSTTAAAGASKKMASGGLVTPVQGFADGGLSGPEGAPAGYYFNPATGDYQPLQNDLAPIFLTGNPPQRPRQRPQQMSAQGQPQPQAQPQQQPGQPQPQYYQSFGSGSGYPGSYPPPGQQPQRVPPTMPMSALGTNAYQSPAAAAWNAGAGASSTALTGFSGQPLIGSGAGTVGQLGNKPMPGAGQTMSLGKAPTSGGIGSALSNLGSGLAAAAQTYANSIKPWQMQASAIPNPDDFRRNPQQISLQEPRVV